MMDLAGLINYANQLNPNNWRYWKSRGLPGRPEDWSAILKNTPLPAKNWLKALTYEIPVKQIFLLVKNCCHGLAKGVCYLCTLKGFIIFVSVTTIAMVCWYYPKELQEYARKGWYGTGSLYRSSAEFVGHNAVILAQYSKKLNSEYVWNYGVLIPVKAVKTGAMYTGDNLMKLAALLGYYCGNQTPQEPQEYND